MNKINDESFLIDVAKHDSYYGLRIAAVKKISDEKALRYIAATDDNSFPTEYDKLMDVYTSFKYPVRDAAKARLKELGYG